MKTSVLLALVCIGIIIGVAIGSAQQRNVPLYGGVGIQSCGAWTASEAIPFGDRSFSQRIGKEGWLTGFVSGVATQRDLRATDGDGLFASMNSYCSAHPLDRIVDGALFIVDQLAKAR